MGHHTTPKKVVHKIAEAKDELIGNKILDKIMKQKSVPEVNWRNVEEIVILPENGKAIPSNFKTNIIKWNTKKLLSNDSTVSKFATRKRIEVNDLPGGQHSVNRNIRFKTPILSETARDKLCE